MKVVYALFTATAWLVSHMPFWLLYGFSDFIALVLFHVLRYRRKVVDQNLARSFPHLTVKERNSIRKQYYHHMADLIVEVIKTQGMSLEDFRKRFVLKNFSCIEDCLNNGQSVLIATGHLGNWEWFGTYMSTFPQYNPYAVVKPLSNPFFHNYINNRRLQFSNKGTIDFRRTFRELVRLKNERMITLVAGDQTPTKDEINYWTTFLHQQTPVFLGIEKIAKALNQAVAFMNLYRVKRGYYEAHFSLLTTTPGETETYDITRAHVEALEKAIYARPYNWLWSHRRWKHKAPAAEVQAADQSTDTINPSL